MEIAEKLKQALCDALPYVQDEARKYSDDGSNEPLELAREIEELLGANGHTQAANVAERPTFAMFEAFRDWEPERGKDYAGAQSVTAYEWWAFQKRYAAMLAAAAPQPPAYETHQVVLAGELVEIDVPVAPQPAKDR